MQGSIFRASRLNISIFEISTSNQLILLVLYQDQAGVNNIETKVIDGENLVLEDETFDAVISRVGLIYFPDQQKALKEMLRVLKPGGKIAAIVYSTPEKK